jgi:hypothetical protein
MRDLTGLSFPYTIRFPGETSPDTMCIEQDYRVFHRDSPNAGAISRHASLKEARDAVGRYEASDKRRRK